MSVVVGGADLHAAATHRRRVRFLAALASPVGVNVARLAIVAVVLAAWQWLPQIPWLQERSPAFDPFFVSSPSRVATQVFELLTGANDSQPVWEALWQTLQATFLGVAVGTLTGALAGLWFSNSPTVAKILSPFVTVMNATPRIALVPIFVIIAGPTITASALTAVFVVFFLVFFNAFTGGRSVPRQTLENGRLLGGTSTEIMRRVRLPYVVVWTFASLPNAISFGLVSVVTAEILTGQLGMGRLLSVAISTTDATLTFSAVVILAIVGTVLVTASDHVQRRILHWWWAAGGGE